VALAARGGQRDIGTDMLNLVDRLGKRYRPIFERSLSAQPSRLEALLRAEAFDGNRYRCLTSDRLIRGKNHHGAQAVAEERRDLDDCCYFTNLMVVDRDGHDGVWTPPKDRAVLGQHQVFTFEIDDPDPTFFAEQLGWLLPLKRWETSDMGHLFHRLKDFADFRLMTVVWSGNKSLHIHVTFSTDLFLNQHQEPTHVHEGHRAHWLLLHDLVVDILRPTHDRRADPMVSWPTQYRRTPNALRELDKPNPLGQPAGSKVRQLVLWEQECRRNPSTNLFLTPSLFVPSIRAARTRQMITAGDMDEEQVAHCADRLRRHYAGSAIEFTDLVAVAGGYEARFRNHAGDRNPSSRVGMAFVTPQLLGVGGDHIDASRIPPLDAPLGDMLAIWCDELIPPDRIDAEIQDRARHRIRSTLPIRAALREQMILCAPEGITKTSAIIGDYPRIMQAIGTERRLGMFAFSDYANAEEKCLAFNARWSGRGYRAVVWRSWSRWYAETAREMDAPVLTEQEAVRAGYLGLWRYIEQKQPEVTEEMRREHRSVWAEMGTDQPVLMTVHDVAHRWVRCGRSRRMFDCKFFDEGGIDAPEQWARSKLALLVHDEVADSHFVDALSAREMNWITGLETAGGDIWSDGRLADQMAAFDTHVAQAGARFDFQRAADLVGREWQPVQTADTGEYPTDGEDRFNLYGSAVGATWHVSRRDWWIEGDGQIADRLVFLTTEQVPVRVVAKAMSDLIVDVPGNAGLGRDVIDVEISRHATSKNIAKLAAPYEAKGWFVISNKLDAIEGLSPMAARGRNDLAERSIVQIVTMHHPAFYERLQALNAWTGSDDLALLAHVDQINQSAGRNRGFRNRGGTEHVLLASQKLYRLLQHRKALPHLRYQLRPRMTREQKNNLK
jgi:hypothetical protein